MAHLNKFTMADMRNVTRELYREQKGRYKNAVNVGKSAENFSYRGFTAKDFMKKMKDMFVANNGNEKQSKIGSWVVTLPEQFKDLDKDLQRKFFDETVNFIGNRYGGADNIIDAVIHYDETTPHITCYVCPVCNSRKTGKLSVSAATVFTRADLQTFHDDFENHIQACFPQFGGGGLVKNGKTFGIPDLQKFKEVKRKLAMAQDDIQEAKRLHDIASKLRDRAEEAFEKAEAYLDSLKSNYKAFRKDTTPLEVEGMRLDAVKKKTSSPFRKGDSLADNRTIVMFKDNTEETGRKIDDTLKLFDEVSMSENLPEIDLSASPPLYRDERKQKPIQPKKSKPTSMAERIYEQAFQQVQGNYKNEDDYEMG